jgi:hypothetical protein
MTKLRFATLGLVLAAGTASGAPAIAACARYQLPSSFSIRQSNGYALTIRTSIDGSGRVNGSATYRTGSDFRRVVGTIENGSFDGRVLKFRVAWSGTGSGRYEGAVDSNGVLSGATRGAGSTATFKGIQRFSCS